MSSVQKFNIKSVSEIYTCIRRPVLTAHCICQVDNKEKKGEILFLQHCLMYYSWYINNALVYCIDKTHIVSSSTCQKFYLLRVG